MFSHYIQHFPDGKPTDTFQDPVAAEEVGSKYTPARCHQKRRPDSEPPAPRKRRHVLSEITTRYIKYFSFYSSDNKHKH